MLTTGVVRVMGRAEKLNDIARNSSLVVKFSKCKYGFA